jgi:hypothetical protein
VLETEGHPRSPMCLVVMHNRVLCTQHLSPQKRLLTHPSCPLTVLLDQRYGSISLRGREVVQNFGTVLEQFRGKEWLKVLAGCGKSRFGSKLGVFLVTQNHHPRPFLRSWGNCARFVFRAFLPKRLFPQPARFRVERIGSPVMGRVETSPVER